VVEFDQANVVLNRYVLGNGKLIAQVNNDVRYFLADQQGSTRLLSDAAGAITSSYDYSAFGELTDSPSVETKYLYTGQQYDAATEMYSLRARYYNPAGGRFLSRDPYPINFGDPWELNRYGYAGGNPVRWTDPTGWATTVSTGARYSQVPLSITEKALLGAGAFVAVAVVYVAILMAANSGTGALPTPNWQPRLPDLDDLWKQLEDMGKLGRTLGELLKWWLTWNITRWLRQPRTGPQDFCTQGINSQYVRCEAIPDYIYSSLAETFAVIALFCGFTIGQLVGYSQRDGSFNGLQTAGKQGDAATEGPCSGTFTPGAHWNVWSSQADFNRRERPADVQPFAAVFRCRCCNNSARQLTDRYGFYVRPPR
jgi:RHS repeat-associated protein